MSRAARSALNFATAVIASAVGVAVGFVATPFLLRWLGAERVGTFRVATEWAGYLTLFEVGVAGALGPLIVRANASGEREAVAATLAAGVRAYLRAALYAMLLGILLLFALPSLTRVPPELEWELQVGFAFTVATFLALPLGVYRPLAEALQRGYLVSLLLMVQGVLTAVVCVLAAYSGWGLVGQFGITAACSLICPLGLLLYFRRSAPVRELISPRADMTEPAAKLRRLNRNTIIFQLVGRVCLFTDNIVIGLFLGPAAVAAFFLTTRLPQAASTQVQAIGGATWAGLAELFQTGQQELFQRRLLELTKLTAVLAAAFVVPLTALTGPFVGLWVGTEHYAGVAVVAFAVLNGCLLPVYSLWGWVFVGTGRVATLVPYMIGQGVLNLAASLVATYCCGMPGPLIGTAFVNLLYNPWRLSLLMRREFRFGTRDLIGPVLGPFAPALVIAAALFAAQQWWPDYSWWRLAGEFGLATGLYLFLAWRLILAESERAIFRRVFDRLRGRDRTG